MIYRKTDKILDEHYRKTDKALLLTGARQVGKTFSVRRLAERKGWRLLGHVCSNIYANVHSKATNGYPYYL